MTKLAKDENGFIQGLLMNPWALVIIAIVLVIGLAMGGLMLLYAPNVAVFVLLSIVGVYFLVRPPNPDPRFHIGIPVVIFALAVIMYFYGNRIMAVVF